VYVRCQCYFHFVSLVLSVVISMRPQQFDHHHIWLHLCQDISHEIVCVFPSSPSLGTQNLL
jgi:hypothetical protein